MGPPLYFSHPACLEHETPRDHPERPARITAIESSLAERAWLGYEVREATAASREMLVAVHSPEYVDAVRSMSENGGGAFDEENVVSQGSYSAAAHASGAACAMVEALDGGSGARGILRNQASRTPRARGHDVRILPVQPCRRGESSCAGFAGRTTRVHLRLGRASRRWNQRHLPLHRRRAVRQHPPVSIFPAPARSPTKGRVRARTIPSTSRWRKDRTRTLGSRCSSTS